jgi:hypothetical protein
MLFNVGEFFHQTEKYLEAEIMYRRTLELREKVLGREHPSTLASMNNLALVLDCQGKYEEASSTSAPPKVAFLPPSPPASKPKPAHLNIS